MDLLEHTFIQGHQVENLKNTEYTHIQTLF